MKELLKKLIQAKTTTENGELAAAEVIADEFGRAGINSRIDNWDQIRANIITRIESAGQRAGLLFACHLDVVGPGEAAWKNPAFSAVETDGKIYGRGAVDMKGGTAAAVIAIRQIVESDVKLKGDIVFAAVAGEETDSAGASRFVDDKNLMKELTPQGLAGVIIPEPTDFEVITAHRGMLWLQISTKGKAAHSSTPQLGVNAIDSMRRVLNELESYEIKAGPHELLGICSMSVNTITGGKAMNVVPDKCSLGIDFRTLPQQNHNEIVFDLQKIFERLKTGDENFDAEISILRQVQPLETDVNSEFVKIFGSAVGISETKAIGYTTDGPHFASLGAPIVIFGPGKPQLCHKPDEYIDISDLEKCVEYYNNIILKFLA